MGLQQSLPQKNGGSGYHPGLSGKIDLSGAFQPVQIWTPDAPSPDLIVGEHGIIHRDLSQGDVLQPYQPQRLYFLPHHICLPRTVNQPVVAQVFHVPVELDGMAVIKSVAEDATLQTSNVYHDQDFKERLVDGLKSEFNQRRKALGFGDWDSAVENSRNAPPKKEKFVDDIAAVTRSFVANPYRH